MACNTLDSTGAPRLEHKWNPGLFNGQPIETCGYCGVRKDGIPWVPWKVRRVIPQNNGFFGTCPAIIKKPSSVYGIMQYITWGCGGYGEVAPHHPAARKRNGEMTLVEEGVAICQRCRGCGIVWLTKSDQQLS